MGAAYWITAGISCLSAAISVGFSIASIRTPSAEVRTAYLYMLARSTALVAVAVISFFTGSVAFVAAVAIAMVIVQGVDAGIGIATRNRMATIGPAVVAVLNLAALIWLLAS